MKKGRIKRIAAVLGFALACVAVPGYRVYSAAASQPKYDVVSIKTEPTYQDEALLARAWNLPVAHAFDGHVDPQSNPSRCGPSSVANAERSFGIAATENSVVSGTGKCWSGYCFMGLTLDELAEIARQNTHHEVTILRDLTYEQFLGQLRLSNQLSQRYLVNFHRAPLFGEGHGHFSPIGGFLEDRDLVLVLDVNAAYKPFLVESRRLFQAMDTVDTSSGKKRGLLVLR